jgi:hypothetical protein
MTPKTAKDVKVIRISSAVYEKVYSYAEAHRMTLTDAVSLLAEHGLMHLSQMNQGAPRQPARTIREEIDDAVQKVLLSMSKEDVAKIARHGPMKH